MPAVQTSIIIHTLIRPGLQTTRQSPLCLSAGTSTGISGGTRSPADTVMAADKENIVGGLIQEGEGGIKKALEEGKGWSTEDVLAYAKTIDDNHPMFAESLEEMDPAMVEAIQQIKFDGKDKFQLAEQAKNHGNQLFKYGKKNINQYRYAITSYTEAEGHAKEAEPSDELQVLLSQIYSNRAFAHLMLKNYKSCKDDCDRALACSPDNVKACYRKAKACQALKQYEDAVAVCERGLGVEPANKELQDVKTKCMQAMEELRRKEQAREDAKRARVEERRARLREAWELCCRSGVRVGEAFYAGADNPKQVEALPFRDQASGCVVWPVLLLYPQYGVTDLVEAMGEDDMLALHLADMFPEEGPPAPWDRNFEFKCSDLEVYFQAKSTAAFTSVDQYVDSVERFSVLIGRDEAAAVTREQAEAELESRDVWKDNGEYWVRVHVGCTLGEVLRHKDHVVAATLPALHVYARGSKAHEDFLKRNGGKRIRTLSPAQQA